MKEKIGWDWYACGEEREGRRGRKGRKRKGERDGGFLLSCLYVCLSVLINRT